MYALIGSVCVLESVCLHFMAFGFQPRDTIGKEGREGGKEGNQTIWQPFKISVLRIFQLALFPNSYPRLCRSSF